MMNNQNIEMEKNLSEQNAGEATTLNGF